MSKLRDMANSLIAKEKEKNDQTFKLEQDRKAKTLEKVLSEFEFQFANYLPMLAEEKIGYCAKFKHDYFENEGTYIEFKKDESLLKMDFNNRNSYRYEFVSFSAYKDNNSNAQFIFDKWDTDLFAIYIYKNLLLANDESKRIKLPPKKDKSKHLKS